MNYTKFENAMAVLVVGGFLIGILAGAAGSWTLSGYALLLGGIGLIGFWLQAMYWAFTKQRTLWGLGILIFGVLGTALFYAFERKKITN